MIDLVHRIFLRLCVTIFMIIGMIITSTILQFVDNEKIEKFLYGCFIGELFVCVGVWLI